MNEQYPSQLLEKAVSEFSKLPGVGRKTALRLVLHLLRQDRHTVESFGQSVIRLISVQTHGVTPVRCAW